MNAQNVTQIGSQGTPRAQVRVAVFEGFGRRDDPRLIWSQFEASQVFSKKKSQFFWRVDTPLQVFPVHTPVRRGQSGTLSGSSMVPGQLRRALALASASVAKVRAAHACCEAALDLRARAKVGGSRRSTTGWCELMVCCGVFARAIEKKASSRNSRSNFV